MDLSAYRRLQATARRCARRAADADDLVQDALLAGLEQGRDDPDWLAGTVRNLALMQARTAGRRRRREADAAAQAEADAGDAAAALDPSTFKRSMSKPSPLDSAAPPVARNADVASRPALMAALPPAARRVAVLALHGLNADEIRCVLGIAETAFRQRLTTIRKALGALPAAQRAEAVALAYVRDPARSVDLQFGLVRCALKAALAAGHGQGAQASDPPSLGTHDMDGHLLVLRPARSGGPFAPGPGAGEDDHRDAHTSSSGGNS